MSSRSGSLTAARGSRRAIPQPVEWPTLGLAAGIYGGWAALTFWHAAIPTWLLVPLGAWLVAWHGSLQHEILHGHPTRFRRFNHALGSIPISLWLPFQSYRVSHLVHHRDERLTDPLDDPESYYWRRSDWEALGPFGRFLVRAQTSLAGRVLIGPAWNIGRFLTGEARAIAAGRVHVRRIWLRHAVRVALVAAWLVVVCRMNLAFYCLAIVYPATSLLVIRSFAEHRAAEGVFERTALVENARILGPLFLFNNLHAAHHERPNMPWYQLPGWYRANRERLVRDNGGLVYDSYWDVARTLPVRPSRPSAASVPRRPGGRLRPGGRDEARGGSPPRLQVA